MADSVRVPYAEIPGFAAVGVAGHRGELVLGRISGVEVACLAGRVHLYEGHPPARVVFGVRLLRELGCHSVLLTNAAGGIRADLAPGTLLLVTDHVNLTGANPLLGPPEDSLPRFPDMTHAYDARLRTLAHEAALQEGIALAEGVYAGVLGPSYETPAEIRMLRTLGADVVGMSTVHEVIALRHRGVRVGTVSVVTNAAAGLSAQPLDHRDVQAAADAAHDRLSRLLERWIVAAGSEPGHG